MNQALLDKIQSEQFRKDDAKFSVGDSVRVHTKVVEGDKERIQIFAGVVIGRRGRGHGTSRRGPAAPRAASASDPDRHHALPRGPGLPAGRTDAAGRRRTADPEHRRAQ